MADNWTDDELRLALQAYLEVLSCQHTGSPFSPTALHRALAAGALAGRSEGSVGRRMSNISAVMAAAGEPAAVRYKPSLDHVGPNVTRTLLRLLTEIRAEAKQSTDDASTLIHRAAILLAQGTLAKPYGKAAPTKRQRAAVTFDRSAEVVAWVLQEAKGQCDACEQPAPVITHPLAKVGGL